MRQPFKHKLSKLITVVAPHPSAVKHDKLPQARQAAHGSQEVGCNTCSNHGAWLQLAILEV